VPLQLSTPVKFVKRIGERIATGLSERGIVTIEDLLYHLPFRYEDRLHPKPLSLYNPGDMASLIGEVRGTALLRTRSGPIFEMTIGITPPDANSEAAMQGLLRAPSPILETVKCMWFHGTYLKDKFRPGQKIALYGKLEGSRIGNALNAPPGSTKFKMIQPTFEILPDSNATGDDAEFTMLEMGRIVPVYESLGGKTPWGSKLTSRWLRRVMWTIFKDLAESDQRADETLPTSLRDRLTFPNRMDALRDLHFPPAGTAITELMSARTPAHRRLIFEEFFYLELGLELKRRRLRERQGTAFVTNDQVREALKQILPFKPTAAQKRVLGEIVHDMRRTQPMRRLLQGDVGSGKTIVAFQAALIAIENGYQVALMAPTEILATQHYLSARKLLSEKISPRTQRPYRIGLLTGSLDDRTKRDTRARIFRGEIDLAIGTHALVEEKVDFANLGLVIVDEQHRFGVQQRFQLTRKNSGATNSGAPSSTGSLIAGQGGVEDAAAVSDPDVLVMTATPIPRTLALTLYGDLEASIIDELPPGRTPIQTRRMPEERSAEVWDFVRKQVAAGRQAYIVYPIIEGATDDQPELDFAKFDEAEDPPSDQRHAADSPAAAAPKARSHQSLGQRPRTAALKNSSRAESPTLPGLPKTSKAAKSKRPTKLRSATDMHHDLQQGPLNGLRLGLLHGRMSPDDKEVTMARFKRGELDVLVSTTVIEVGVDVPNATVMVIEHADRFGLAQLHQLRGRVGRGAAKSFCVLVTSATVTPEADLRLNAMVQTQDGFALAELDLQQRGPGEFFGTKQAGLPEFRVANLARDRDLLELARHEAILFAETKDPNRTDTEREAVWSRLKLQWQRRYGLVEA
jgi:ATP-dependent DNA helicase RecG